MLPIHCNWPPTTLNSILFHYNASNHLKINTIGPEFPTTSTNRLQNIKHLLRDITVCLHLRKIVPNQLKVPEIVVKLSRIVPNRLAMPYNARNCCFSPPIHSEAVQVVSKLLSTVTHHQNFVQTSINCSQSSCLVTKSPQLTLKSSSHSSQSSLNRLYRLRNLTKSLNRHRWP